MAKITRKHQKQFGSSAPGSSIGVFGSLAAGSPAYSTDPDTIQSLSNFLTGWTAETIATNRPALEDFNALDYLTFYQLAYIFQAGVPEWISTCTYYIGSIASDGLGAIYYSIQDNNTNHALSDGSWWTKIAPFTATAATALSGSQLQSVSAIDRTARSISVSTGISTSSPATSQGGAYTQIAVTITPKTSGGKIKALGMVQVFVPAGNGGNTCAGLWKDSDSNFLCIGDAGHGSDANGSCKQVWVYAEVTAPDLTPIAFKVKVSQPDATTNVLTNQVSGGASFNSYMGSFLRVWEEKA